MPGAKVEIRFKRTIGFSDSLQWLLAGRTSTAALFVVFCSTIVTTATAQTFEDGARAFKDQDYQTALRIFRPLAEHGDARAQLNLGMMYNNGRGVPKNYVEAANWTRKAAEQGAAEAEFTLGLMYENGQGFKKNDAEAVNWYRKSAEQGLPEGQNALGFMLEKGHGVPKNETDAMNWYRKAAEQGWAEAQYNLGLMYYKGPRAIRDKVAAYMWFVILTTVHGDVNFVRETIMENMRAPYQNEAAAAASGFMTRAQVQQAEDFAKAWLDQHGH